MKDIDTKGQGELCAQLLTKWNAGDSLSDGELKVAIKGCKFMVGFCGHGGLFPLAHYYATKLVSLESALNSR